MRTTNEADLVSRWMSKHVYTVKPEDAIIDAVELMRIHRIRHIPVLERGRLVGIISDRDVRHALPARRGSKGTSDDSGTALFETRISELMTRHPITVEPQATIREAAEIVCREKIGALPVVSDGLLVGIVSAEDLLWAFVERTTDEE